jgi:hypothetical protein
MKKIFGRFKYAEEFCQRLTDDRILWTMTVIFDVEHYDEDDEEPYIYHDYIVEYTQ